MDLKIKFELNKELDKQMASVFLSRNKKVGGVDFSLGVIKPHPELEKIKLEVKENMHILNDCFDKYYLEHEKELQYALKTAKEDWGVIETIFIEQLNILFKNPAVPEGKYIAYLSTINCNPRFLDTKTFQVYWKHRDGTNMVVAHEVLHFFFYSYAIKKHPDVFGSLDTNTGLFWVLAEVFNDVVLSLSELNVVHGKDSFYSYPAHKEYSKYLKKVWAMNLDIDNWLHEGYDYLSSRLK